MKYIGQMLEEYKDFDKISGLKFDQVPANN